MTENEFESKLDLLMPGEIPLECSLDPETADKLSQVITIFLQALETTSTHNALAEITRALDCLGTIETSPADVTNTDTCLKSQDVEDYDRYFKINRIQTSESEVALIGGLIVNTQTFLSLCQRCGDRLDSQQIELQKQGFITYARLLARNFKLNIPDT
ncbi:MAG: hypothetical protein AAFQ41_11355 [Cyanobacteria bacterium J06623_7]